MIPWILSILVALPIWSTGQTGEGQQLDKSDENTRVVNDLVNLLALEYTRKPNTHALAIGILDNRNSARYFYGQVDREGKQLPDENTSFEIGPVTTTFTATLLASLSLNGAVDPDTPVTIYLPDSVTANPALRGITLKNLANHSSGLPRLPDNLDTAAFGADPAGSYGVEKMFRFLMDFDGGTVPGEAYAYSDLGFGLLGVILSEITGKTYGELIEEYISAPLALTGTTDSPQGEEDAVDDRDEKRPLTADAFAGAMGLKSNLIDMFAYIKTHFASPDTDIEHALAYTRQFTFFDPPETDIGLGWHMRLNGDNLVYQHQGQTLDSSTFVAFAPDRKKAVIILSNAPESVESMGNKILEALLDQK